MKWPLFAVFFMFCGGLLTNLDRVEHLGKYVNSAKELLPRYVRVFIPDIPWGNASANTTLTGRIIAVYDGDTATLLSEDGSVKYKIRFYGMDAPEAAQSYGQIARQELEKMILERDVTVKVVNVDNYGRSVGKVYCAGEYINKNMISAGLAWWYKSYSQNEFDLAAAEAEARIRQRGLWQERDPVPPWEYRKDNK